VVRDVEIKSALALARDYGFTDGPVPRFDAVRPLRLTADGVERPRGRPGLQELAEQLVGCTRCPLSEGRHSVVVGEGDPNAELMFIDGAPGAAEDRTGKPCQGEAGELLTAMIEAGMQRARRAVFITHAVKCRPTQDVSISPEDEAACRPFVEQQIAAVRPRALVILGQDALDALCPGSASVAELRGQFIDVCGVPAMPTHHPRELLANPTLKRAVWQDLKRVIARLGWSRS
jgi:uracil-DNA glycosylase